MADILQQLALNYNQEFSPGFLKHKPLSIAQNERFWLVML